VKEVDEAARESVLEQLEQEYKSKQKEVKTAKSDSKELEKSLEELKEQFRGIKDDLKSLKPMQILSELEYFNLSMRFGQVFTAGPGWRRSWVTWASRRRQVGS
jgi:DNA-directed RNA polymerase subunit beta'